MKCPYCNSDTVVIDSRTVDSGKSIKRRRNCLICDAKFFTIEKVFEKNIIVIKKNNEKELLDEKKIFLSIFNSVTKSISDEQIKKAAGEVYDKIQNSGVFQITTIQIAEMVLDVLERFDKIGYIRFASMHLELQTLDDVKELIEKIE